MKEGLSFISVLILSGFMLNGAYSEELRRLDPHGGPADDLHQMNLLQHQECKTCHTPIGKSAKFGLKENISDRCVSCHSALPHSGVQEHMGKSAGSGGTITCLSCHRAHRPALNPGELQAQEYFKKPSTTIMMKRTCEECHKWPEH